MAKLPPIDIRAHWIKDALHRGDRERAMKLLGDAMAAERVGAETLALAEYLASAKRGRQPFGVKHRWPDIGADNDEMRDAGMTHAERMDALKLKYHISDESKLKTYIAKWEAAMDEIRAIDFDEI